VRAVFEHIAAYKPRDIELDTTLHPFVPDYIPSIGEIDAFLKVPRPDGKADGLGLTVLDEPAAQQSDPNVLALQIRMTSKQSNLQAWELPCARSSPLDLTSRGVQVMVGSIEHADQNPQRITTWINSIQDVHRKKPPPTVNFARPMPSIDQLTQVWPAEFEAVLKQVRSATLPAVAWRANLTTCLSV
jgi:intraflagellar transport protein 46